MNWQEIKKKYKHFNKDWDHYPKEYCDSSIIPPPNELFKEYQVCKSSLEEEPEWIESTHPFCMSCYSNYKEVCKNVGTYFKMESNWDKDLLHEFVNKFIMKQSNETNMDNKITSYENGLTILGECINTRWFQHDQCFERTDHNNNNVEVSNSGHMYFILLIALEFKKLYFLYKILIDVYNAEQEAYNNKKRHKNLILETQSNVINICRNIIKNYGNKESKENIDKILFTKDSEIKKRKSNSPIRNNKNSKQSRNKNAYKVKPETIKQIRKKYFGYDN